MSKSLFNIVLVAPDIPGNTGTIGRTCVALGIRLILIKPYGFELTESSNPSCSLIDGVTKSKVPPVRKRGTFI